MYQHYDIPQPKWDPKHNKWILSIMIDGKRKQFVSRTPKMPGKKECRERCLEWLENGAESNSLIKLNKAFDLFLNDYHNKNGANEQYHQFCDISRLHILPFLGNFVCSKISIDNWQSIITNAKPIMRKRQDGTTWCRSEVLSKKYVKKIKDTICAFCKWAQPRKYIYADPSKQLYVPSDRPTIGKEILQLSDIEKLFSEPLGYWFERALLFEVLTGWRPGEVIGLQRSDYDQKTGILHMNRSINCRNEITPGKNRNARRTLELAPEVKSIIETQLKETAYLDSEWMFPNQLGCMPNQETVRRTWRRIVKRKNLPKGTTPYSLRHTFYSHTEAYLPDRIIKNLFGHSAKTDGHAIYGAHEVKEELHDAAERLSVTPLYKTAKKKYAE